MKKKQSGWWIALAIVLVLMMCSCGCLVVALLAVSYAPHMRSAGDAVAIVEVKGTIMSGEAPGGFGETGIAYSGKVIADLKKAEDDPSVAAIVLDVDSPGGGVTASADIHRALTECYKPIVTSMGDVAASGGYYISMAAGKLIADPMTLTGSIGVVGGKLDLAGTYAMLGVRKTTIARGRFASLFSETGGFSPEQRASVEKIMRQTYDEFVAKAARQRGMTTQALEQLAQGRVYTGAQARDVRLVDALGGFGDAVQEMKHLIGLQPEDKVSLVAFPKELTLLDVLQKAMGANAQLARSGGADPLQAAALSAADLAKPLAQALALGRILAAEHVALMLPLVLNLQ